MIVENVVLSRPARVRWAGWETTTTLLQQHGWELSLERDVYRMEMRLAIRHKDYVIHGISSPLHEDFIARLQTPHSSQGIAELPPFQMRHMTSQMTVHLHDDLSRFEPIDAMPQLTTVEIKHIEDFNIFATPLARTEEIIVEPETVAQLLDRIKTMQAPGQADIRARNRARERREAIPRQRFHAQILSFEAA